MDNKEAAIKLLGMGIVLSTDEYSVTLSASGDSYLVNTKSTQNQETFPFVANNREYQMMALNTAVARFFELAFPPRTR